jgi:CheY-like chemotaxis protein
VSRKKSQVRVLVVEDEFIIALQIQEYVRDYGCQLTWRESTLEGARATVLRYTPDLCLLDTNLEGEQNFEIAGLLKQLKVPFAFITDVKKDAVPDEWKNYLILKKPFIYADISRILDSLLGSSSAFA